MLYLRATSSWRAESWRPAVDRAGPASRCFDDLRPEPAVHHVFAGWRRERSPGAALRQQCGGRRRIGVRNVVVPADRPVALGVDLHLGTDGLSDIAAADDANRKGEMLRHDQGQGAGFLLAVNQERHRPKTASPLVVGRADSGAGAGIEGSADPIGLARPSGCIDAVAYVNHHPAGAGHGGAEELQRAGRVGAVVCGLDPNGCPVIDQNIAAVAVGRIVGS